MDRLEDLRKKRRIAEDMLKEIEKEISKIEDRNFAELSSRINSSIDLLISHRLIKDIKDLVDLSAGIEIFAGLLLKEGCIETEESFNNAIRSIDIYHRKNFVKVSDLRDRF